MRSPAPLAVALLSVVVACLPQRGRNSVSDGNRPVSPSAAAAVVAAPAPPSGRQVVLRADNDRGVPLHAAAGDRAVSARLPGGTAVALLESQDGGHWLRVRAPDGTSGWLIDKYVVPAAGQGDAAAPGELCPLAAPSAGAVFAAASPADSASLPGVARRLGESGDLVVVSYNLWELYDGRDGDSYLGGEDHPEATTLDPAHAARRVAALAAPLAGLSADVFVFQEVENAALACAVARAADERSAWHCWASDWAHEPHPQNVAVASRVAGTVVQLDPGEGMGQRGALELSVAGTALRIAAVHLKSSVGAEGIDDCRNAAKRMAVAQGLVLRQREVPDSAYLVVGDFNVDPADAAKTGYDRTDDILVGTGAADLVPRFADVAALAAQNPYGTVIDRAFFRPGASVAAQGLRFVEDAPTGGWASDHRPLVVTLRLGP
jgi:endonuclease/exonuclease/phosphatase family metal-dependent hydrolase